MLPSCGPDIPYRGRIPFGKLPGPECLAAILLPLSGAPDGLGGGLLAWVALRSLTEILVNALIAAGGAGVQMATGDQTMLWLDIEYRERRPPN